MIKKKKIEADMTNLKSETTTNQEQGKKIEADMTPGYMHSAVRRRSRRWWCGGAKTISPFSPCVLCVFEDNDTKRQVRLCETYHRES